MDTVRSIEESGSTQPGVQATPAAVATSLITSEVMSQPHQTAHRPWRVSRLVPVVLAGLLLFTVWAGGSSARADGIDVGSCAAIADPSIGIENLSAGVEGASAPILKVTIPRSYLVDENGDGYDTLIYDPDGHGLPMLPVSVVLPTIAELPEGATKAEELMESTEAYATGATENNPSFLNADVVLANQTPQEGTPGCVNNIYPVRVLFMPPLVDENGQPTGMSCVESAPGDTLCGITPPPPEGATVASAVTLLASTVTVNRADGGPATVINLVAANGQNPGVFHVPATVGSTISATTLDSLLRKGYYQTGVGSSTLLYLPIAGNGFGAGVVQP